MKELRVGGGRTFQVQEDPRLIRYVDEDMCFSIRITERQRVVIAQAIAIVEQYEQISTTIEEAQL